MKKKILVLFGGASSEHEVSLASACSVLKNIPADKYDIIPMGITKDGDCFIYSGSPDLLPDGKWLTDGKNLEPAVISCNRSHHGIIRTARGNEIERIDAVFPVLHGKNGEDGTMQGMLEIAGLPYVGCDTASSAVCMDKAITNALADFYGIAQAKWTAFNRREYLNNKDEILKQAAENLGFPIFVKPANAGSSVGISKAKNLSELAEGCEKAFIHDKKLVLEEGIDGSEIECAVLGNSEPIASVLGEVVPCNEFYDYEAKYLAGESELLIPAPLSEELTEAVRETAIKAYRAMGCAGLARVDFFVCKGSGKILLNELNTIPGFTSISMYSKLFAASGISYPELLDRLINFAFER